MRATLAQLSYIEALSHGARVPYVVGAIQTADEASAAIDSLQQQIEITEGTRRAVFAKLRGTGKLKADMYAAIGCTSMSASGDASEWHGKRALRWLDGESVEVRRVVAAEPPKEPTRPSVPVLRRIGRIPAHQPAPEVTHHEVEVPNTRPVDVPSVRTPGLPRRPGRIGLPKSEAAPDAIPGIDVDPATGVTLPFVHGLPRLPTDDDLTWIEEISEGATKETAAVLLAMIRARGIHVDRAGRLLPNWNLWTSELSLLGLTSPSRVFYGSLRNRFSNSDWWSRNHPYEERRCEPPF